MAELAAGQRFRVARVVDQDSAFLRYLADCGLDLGAEGVVIENRPESGALVVRVDDRATALGREAAGKVLVSAPTSDGQSG
jgi:DtxR family Mn-dependent transcriptional regulator